MTSSESSRSGIWELSFQAAVGLLVVLSISILAYYALAKLRGLNSKDSETDDLLRKNFEEMRSEGDISEAEFRKIRASLDTPVVGRSLNKSVDLASDSKSSKET